MSLLTLLTWLGLALVGGGATFALVSRLGVSRRLSLGAGLLAFAAIVTFLSLLRTGIQPVPVEVRITQPRNATEVEGYKLRFEGVAVPRDALVTLLIRSETAELWWVQEVTRPDPVTGRWSIEGNLGKPDVGQGKTFSIIALASADGPFLRLLLDRRLRPGMVLRAVPMWNKSEPLVVRRIS